jgi:hypothetical protein
MHRNSCHRSEAIGQWGKRCRIGSVECPARAPAILLIGRVQEDQSEAWIHHPEIDSDLVQSLVEQLGEQSRGQIDGLT